MAFEDADGLFWRYRFDAHQIADRDEVPHTAARKAAVHIRERRAFFRGRIRSDEANGRTANITVVHGPEGDTHVDARTGEILWIDVDPPESDSEMARPSGV